MAPALLLAAALCFPAAAQATSDRAQTAADILDPLILTGPNDMDFGSVTPSVTPGTIVLTPAASATCTPAGGPLRTGPCQAALFEGSAWLLFLLRVQQPPGNQINLDGPGGATMRLDSFTFAPGPGLVDLGSAGTERRFLILNLNGDFSFHVGGRLQVGAMQAPGRYVGTFAVELNYD